jgi:hypothetical protein
MIENYSKDMNYVDFKITQVEGMVSTDYINNMKQINSNYSLLDKKVDDLNIKYQFNSDELNKYEDNLVSGDKKPSLEDARKQDAETYLQEQNYIYILGTITLAIVFVGAIVIIKN